MSRSAGVGDTFCRKGRKQNKEEISDLNTQPQHWRCVRVLKLRVTRTDTHEHGSAPCNSEFVAAGDGIEALDAFNALTFTEKPEKTETDKGHSGNDG